MIYPIHIQVKDYYWGAAELDKDNAHKLVDAVSDSSYSHPIDTAAKIHAMRAQSPVFVYHFGYRCVKILVRVPVYVPCSRVCYQ